MKTIAIIGGGASGVAAALRIRQLKEHCRVILLEKNERILKKLLVTGNGRCNITNRNVAAAAYSSDFPAGIIEQYDYACVKRFLESIGIYIKSDDTGRCYPLSESAANVVNLLRHALEQYGVEVRTDFEVSDICRETGGFCLRGPFTIHAHAVIFAFGSAASVKGFHSIQLLQKLQIPTRQSVPALCPIPCREPFCKQLKGVRVKGSVSLGKTCEKGEIQFTDTALSGICAFNLSAAVRNDTTLFLNFNSEKLPDTSLKEMLVNAALHSEENASLLDALFVKKLALVLLKCADISPSASPRELPEQSIDKLISLINAFPVRVSPPRDFAKAQTVRGGVEGEQINPATLECKQCPGAFVTGEVADADGPCGGYNLHWAWASGLCAAEHIIKYLEQNN